MRANFAAMCLKFVKIQKEPKNNTLGAFCYYCYSCYSHCQPDIPCRNEVNQSVLSLELASVTIEIKEATKPWSMLGLRKWSTLNKNLVSKPSSSSRYRQTDRQTDRQAGRQTNRRWPRPVTAENEGLQGSPTENLAIQVTGRGSIPRYMGWMDGWMDGWVGRYRHIFR